MVVLDNANIYLSVHFQFKLRGVAYKLGSVDVLPREVWQDRGKLAE
jgi:hypothetical protein